MSPPDVDSDARRLLSQDIRRLVTGRMTNDEFDDAYYSRYEKSSDRAVREIAGFCYGLYSSDLPIPIRLRGRYAVSKETRSQAARAVLFLRAGLSYDWPNAPDAPLLRLLYGLAVPLGFTAGAVLSLMCIPLYIQEPSFEIGQLAMGGALLLIGSTVIVLVWRLRVRTLLDAFRASGNYEVWPFLQHAEFEQAKRSSYLLGQ